MMLKKLMVIFSGFNQRAITSFLRTLKKNNAPFAIVALSPNDPIFKTAYRESVVCTRQSISLDLEDLIQCIKMIHAAVPAERLVIAPSSEALNRFILKHRKILEEMNCDVPLVDQGVYESISDKWSFRTLCKKHHLPIPDELPAEGDGSYPIVAKPRRYFSPADGRPLEPVFLYDQQSFHHFQKKAGHDFYFQKYIEGHSFYLLYYFHRAGLVFRYSQQNLVQQPDGKSIVAALSSDYHQTEESRKYEILFSKLKFWGLVMVEVRRMGKMHYMIEANPRFWGPSQLFVDAGVNLFEAFLHDLGFLTFLPSFHEPEKRIRYFWHGGMRQVNNSGAKLTFISGREHEYVNELPIWLESDIYRRPDTCDLFKEEFSEKLS